MKYTIILGFVCSSFLYASAQLSVGRPRFAIPSLSDILRDTGTPGPSVVDLSSSPDGFGGSHGGLSGQQDHVGDPQNGFGSAPHEEHVNHVESKQTSTDQGHAHTHESDVHQASPTGAGAAVITDAHGNVPPPPSGTHVDLPGEHGNTNDFAVIHHGEAPIRGSPEMHPPGPHGGLKSSPHENNLPKIESLPGSEHTVPVPMESAHGPNTVSHGPGHTDHSENPFHPTNVHHDLNKPGSRSSNFEDLAAIGNTGLVFPDNGGTGPVHTVAELLDLQPGDPLITRNHVSSPHIQMHADIPAQMDTSASKTDGFVSPADGFVTAPGEVPIASIHEDLPGEHGNSIDGQPLSHRKDENNFGLHPGAQVGRIHVDMPGEHGNLVNGIPTVHREAGVVTGTPDLRNQHTGIHIDQPGEHGNMLNEPALHLPPGATVQDAIDAGIIPDPSLPIEPQTGTLAGTSSVGHQNGISVGNVHVDLPGQHGNPSDGHPVVHREGPSAHEHQSMSPLDISNAEIQTGAPTGNVHVDLPGEHGNSIGSRPVIHREGPHSVIPAGNVHVDLPGEHGNPLDGHAVVHREGTHTIGAGTGIPTVTGSFGSAGNVHVDLPGQHGNPTSGHPVVHREGTHGVSPPTMTSGTSIFGPQAGLPLGNVHVDLPGEHGNPVDGHPVIHREANHLGSQAMSPVGNVHVDMPGQHGNPIDSHPVIHRGANHLGSQAMSPVGNVHVDMPGEHGNPIDSHPVIHREANHLGSQAMSPVGNVHVDMPGQHGNPIDSHPVIHRDANHLGSQAMSPVGNVHVDMPGQHGNPIDSHPVIHRDANHLGSQAMSPVGNVHVDMPGQHGNPIDSHPVIHREANHLGSQAMSPVGNVHVDMPGQHGNPIDSHPVIHREANHLGSQAMSPVGNVHVDMPGQHGNPIDSHPVIHRDANHLGSQAMSPVGNVHVDMPGQHGNPIDSHPVIHREANHLGSQAMSPVGNVHVDMPGEHGNSIDSHPVIHREVTHLGQHNDNLRGQKAHPGRSGIHIDAKRHHGNQVNEPALHLLPDAIVEDARATGIIPDPIGFGPSAATPVGNVHIDMPGEHGTPIDSHPVIHREVAHLGPNAGTLIGNIHVDMPGENGVPIGGIPVIHREASIPGTLVGQKNHPGHSGIHIDAPGQHGNELNEPALYLPPGATIEDARAVGVIPGPGGFGPKARGIVPGLWPIVQTGVLPGTKNVAIPNSGGNAFKQQGGLGPKRDNYPVTRSNKGDLQGIPTVHLSESVGHNDLDRTNFGVMDDRSVLLTSGGRRRDGRRGGKRRGRGRGGRGRGRGGRRRGREGRGRGRGGRKRRPTTTTTTTTTTPVPKKSGGGSGITIIRTSRPNPLAALGKALRSALNIRNSGGGGLLGSLIRSAVGVQQGFGPPPGRAMVGPIRIQPVGGPLFGGLLRGKR